ncbi:hypothetical protein OBBRIDRAFT_722879 [Obba rivulosa]|uniref:F-box domain-containing protein n=1 Tax=Obba rivulosa TaxID=1052685 RepID=A0A8E2J4C6_9APHY|nr:hypothetical protein OBBRIDRAFT_722879 [Obba rivulosa]
MQRMPSEIRDLIVENVYPDVPAVKACSLTCRAWLPNARRTLFHSISLDPKSHGHAFRRLLASSPHVTPYIRELEIRVRTAAQLRWDNDTIQGVSWPTLQGLQRIREPESATLMALLQSAFPSNASPLKSVTSLIVAAMPITYAVITILAPHFPNVRTLTVDGCKGLSFTDFIKLLGAFPRVHTLRLVAAQWLHQKSVGFDSILTFPRLRRLEVSRKIDVAPLVTWMLDHSAASDLNSLSCSISSPKHAVAIGLLLHAVGDTLQHLEVGFAETQHPTDILVDARFDLTPCTGLRSLRMLCAEPQLSSYQPSLSWVVILLSKLDPPWLKEIVIVIRSSNLWALNLEALDVILSHARFASLERVVFDIEADTSGEQQGPEDRKQICRRMSELHAKGTLGFDDH